MRRLFILLLVASLFIGFLPADQTSLSGPIEGFTFDDPTGSFRAVIGFPGSASLGPAILSGFGHGSVAPQKDYGLAFSDGQSLLVTELSANGPSTSALLAAVDQPEDVAWSGDGSLAVLFSRSGNWIQTIGGLPNSPAAGASIDVSYLGGSLSTVAVDTTGKRVAVGIAGDSGGVFLITSGGDPISVWTGSKPIALAFSGDGSALYVLDSVTLQFTAVQLADLTAQAFSLDGLGDPVAIKPARDSANRSVLYVAGRKDFLLRTYDLSSFQILTDTPLDFSPSEIRDFGRNSFLLAPRSTDSSPLWLFTSAPQQAVYFVPTTPAAVGGPQ
jgi:hypothetical protein